MSPRIPPSLVASLLGCASMLGCAHFHVPGNEPGHIDVKRPPEHIDRRELEAPDDPGERMFVLSYGFFAGGGVAGGGERGARGAFGIGPEISAQFGTSDFSHAEDGGALVLPRRAVGTNFGWTLVSSEGDPVGPLYAELEAREIVGFAAGWGWDPDDARHGPQATLSLGPLYLRGAHMLGGPSELHVGMMIKGSLTWIQSR